jgi:hypothetical protein
MNIVIALIAASTLGGVADPAWSEAIFDRALVDCEGNRRPSKDQRNRMREVYAMELDAGVPDAVRGITLSAFCNEASYVLSPGRGDGGRAVGILQHWGSHRDGIRRVQVDLYGEARGDDAREDWFASTTYWLRKLIRNAKRARSHCKGRRGYASREMQVWASGNLTAVARPKCARRRWSERLQKDVCVKFVPHCARAGRFETGHLRRLRRWHEDARGQYTVSDAR